jgi:hypothetical protein
MNLWLLDVILSRVGVTYKAGFGLDDWIYCTLYIHNLRLQALLLDYTLYSSPLLAFSVVSWQRIYNSLTVTSYHTWSHLFTA